MTQPLLTVATLLTVIPSLPRVELGRLVQRMIDRMDDIDGDPDSEVYGDELDGSLGEDDFHSHNAGICPGAGCPVSDPGGGMVEDEGQMGTVPYPKTGCTQGAALSYGRGATRRLEASS